MVFCTRLFPPPLPLLSPDPLYPGALASDWTSLWMFLEPDNDGFVWQLAASGLDSGWNLTAGRWGGYGRKVRRGTGACHSKGRERVLGGWAATSDLSLPRVQVFIKGETPGSGCWFSTDYLVQDL